MGKRDTSPPPEEGPPLNGWILSFSDCMTNLLCFFVLLVSFSSFDSSAQGRIEGAFTSMMSPSLSDRKTDPTDAIVPPQDRPYDPTAEGAEKPTDQPPEPVRKTQSKSIPDVKAFHDRVTIRIPAGNLFWASGDLLTPAGRSSLKLIGAYMRPLPVRAVVRPRGQAGPDAESHLRRAWSVIACMSEEGGVSRDRFCIAGDAGQDAGGQDVVEILLLRKEAAQ